MMRYLQGKTKVELIVAVEVTAVLQPLADLDNDGAPLPQVIGLSLLGDKEGTLVGEAVHLLLQLLSVGLALGVLLQGISGGLREG